MKTQKQVNILLAVLYIIIVIAVSVIINPIYSSLSTDILTKNTPWPGVIELLKTLLEFTFYALILSAVIYSNYVSPRKSNISAVCISGAGIAVKYIANLCFDIFTNGIGSIQSTQIFSVCVYIGIELAQVVIVYSVSRRMIRLALSAEKEKRNASRSLGVAYEESPMLPFTTVIDKSNPLMRSAFIASALIAIPTVVGRLIYDIAVVGAPSGFADLMWIILYYAFDVLSVFIGYLIIIFALTAYFDFGKKKEKASE